MFADGNDSVSTEFKILEVQRCAILHGNTLVRSCDRRDAHLRQISWLSALQRRKINFCIVPGKDPEYESNPQKICGHGLLVGFDRMF